MVYSLKRRGRRGRKTQRRRMKNDAARCLSMKGERLAKEPEHRGGRRTQQQKTCSDEKKKSIKCSGEREGGGMGNRPKASAKYGCSKETSSLESRK